MSTRDSQRQRLWNAETDIGNGLYFLSLAEAQTWLDRKFVQTKWWRKRSDVRNVDLRQAKGEYCYGSQPEDGRGLIELSPGTCCSTYIMHELGHILAGYKHGHDATFAGALLALKLKAGGRYPAKLLREAFEKHRVEWVSYD